MTSQEFLTMLDNLEALETAATIHNMDDEYFRALRNAAPGLIAVARAANRLAEWDQTSQDGLAALFRILRHAIAKGE